MRFSLAILTAALLGALPPGGTFVDDDGSIHEGNIEAIAAAGITKGCNPPANDRYCPGEGVTRGEMAAFIVRAQHLEPVDVDRFSDDTGHTFENAINSLAAADITKGCNPPDNDRFCPDRAMTRGEMAAMLVRTFGYPPAVDDHFSDDTGHTFENAINSLAAADITKGCNPPDNDSFCPDHNVSRAEMATFLARALKMEPIVPPHRPHQPVVVEPRDTWDARPAKAHLMTKHTVERLTIHHAGTQSGTTGPAQFRGWQNWHMDGQGWGDIAYHLLIGIDGTVYQGRDPTYRGDTGTAYDTTGHFLVVVEGNFDHEKPTPAQVESLTRVLAAASEEYRVSSSTISGHRDHAATTCPGTHLHAMIDSGELQKAVDALLDSGGVDLIWPQ
ncbi:MAG TPA: S-layer homology domain-containing protein [Acidimicrobiia bacterium]